MTDNASHNDHSPASTNIDVAIIGGGPSGLAAATQLKQRGINNVVVLEREPHAGGIPRHCGHPPFGMREFRQILKGPRYAEKLVRRALDKGVEIRTSATVIEVREGGVLLIHDPSSIYELHARRIICATGVRERPRSARLISGTRPVGILSTGALQSMVYLESLKPFSRPLIVGTELVSFSAIMTCRHAGIKPVGMIEETANVTAFWPTALFPALVGVPLHLNTSLISVMGDKRVEAALVEDRDGTRREISCDGIILTGDFTPESSLAGCGHLQIDAGTNGPAVDRYGRCCDPIYFATGNLLRPVETAGWSWNEGRQTGNWVADDLHDNLPGRGQQINIMTDDRAIKFVMPQTLDFPVNHLTGMSRLQLRFTTIAKGTLVARQGERIIYKKSMKVKPETRVLIPIKDMNFGSDHDNIHLSFEM